MLLVGSKFVNKLDEADDGWVFEKPVQSLGGVGNG